MRIIPAIDIIDGACVRLTQGKYDDKTVYNQNPVEVAQEFERAGLKYLHVVDLDGAKAGSIINATTLKSIAKNTSLKIDFGGGVRTDDDIQLAFDCGANQVTAGSIAVKSPKVVWRWMEAYGPDKIILGADVKDDKIAISGWQEKSSNSITDLLNEYKSKGIKYIVCTDISKDGTLSGPALDIYKTILQNFPSVKLIASGGISTMADIELLHAAGLDGAIIGKAIYEKRISLQELAAFNNKYGT